MSELLLAKRLLGLEVSPILALSQLAKTLKQEGRDVIDMTVGEPDFDTPDHIGQAATRAIADGFTRYTALAGHEGLRQAIADRAPRLATLEEVICCAGAKQVISNAFAATLAPGDQVVIPTPGWASYADMVRLQEGDPVNVAGIWSPTTGWRLDVGTIADAFGPKTRWLLLNSPSNPSGAVQTEAELKALAEALRRAPHVWVMTDDIYDQISFDGRRPPHLLEVAPDLSDRTLCVNGVSKAYAMTGWRLGWGVGPLCLIKAMTIVQSQLTSAPSSLSQAGALAALEGPEEGLALRREAYQSRRDLMRASFSRLDGVVAPPPEGAFYYFPSMHGLLGRQNGIDDDQALARYLLMEAGVAAVPGGAFGAPGHLRFSFALSEALIRQAMDRMAGACRRLGTA